jgi:gamma-F420-2:alpha-L-glutamate ligase
MLLDGTQHEANFIFQEYVATSHGRDVRVLVVGGRPVAAMERRATNGSFKSNVSLGAEAVPFELKPDLARLAVDAADALNLDVAGVDILFDRDGYRICEANSSPGFQGLERATGVDVPQLVFESMFARRRRMGPRLHRAVDSVKRLYAGVGG